MAKADGQWTTGDEIPVDPTATLYASFRHGDDFRLYVNRPAALLLHGCATLFTEGVDVLVGGVPFRRIMLRPRGRLVVPAKLWLNKSHLANLGRPVVPQRIALVWKVDERGLVGLVAQEATK
jgi:hypothetical protein